MSDITLIILCAGESSRFQLSVKKQWIRIDDEPLWLHVTNKLSAYANFEEVIVVGHQNEIDYMKKFSTDYTYVVGGKSRQESIQNAIEEVSSKFVMITDVARACIPKSIIKKLIKNKKKASVIVPALEVSDTVVYNNTTINREFVKLIQTPQLSRTTFLQKALGMGKEFTDESSAIKDINGTVHYIQGSLQSTKITFGKEIQRLSCLKKPSTAIFVGNGIDIHPFQAKKQMVLGGIKIDSEVGFKAHSDGDVLIHSLIDALLGACGAGDIGDFFPDTDPIYKDADSTKLLEYIVQFISNVGYEIINIDLTILAEVPKISPYKIAITSKISQLLQIKKQKINIKATTAEKMSFVGRKEGVVVLSSATLKYYDWTKK